MSLSKLIEKVQKEFNKFIRNRDKDKGCISCGAGVEHAGHYYSAGHFPALRFSEINTNGQCLRCNNFLHGNLILYGNGLLKKVGQQKVDLLDSAATRNGVHKWNRLELQALYLIYKQKNKDLAGDKKKAKVRVSPKTELTYFQKRFQLKLKS